MSIRSRGLNFILRSEKITITMKKWFSIRCEMSNFIVIVIFSFLRYETQAWSNKPHRNFIVIFCLFVFCPFVFLSFWNYDKITMWIVCWGLNFILRNEKITITMKYGWRSHIVVFFCRQKTIDFCLRLSIV